MHYYQPMWTLVGGGMKKLSDTGRPMKDVLPDGVEWIKDRVTAFDPNFNRVRLGDGKMVQYDYLVVALGIQLKYEQVLKASLNQLV
jgi:sulfide:quinone oxidoreductase